MTYCNQVQYSGIYNANGVYGKQQRSADKIISTVSRFLKVPKYQIESPSRKRYIVEARHICMYLIRKNTTLTLVEIGKLFGNRDHSTVMYGCSLVEDLMDYDNDFRSKVNTLKYRV